MGSPRELTLLERVARGDAAAVTTLIEQYTPVVWTIARRQLGAQCAEDVVQEVFLVVSRKLPGYRPSGSFTSWLFEIARKVVANHRRRQGRHFVRRDSENSLESVPSQEPDPAATLERGRLVALFYRALDQMSEKYRTVFVLYEIEGLSTQAIAELGGLKLSTVKVQLLRARARFMHAYHKLVREEADLAGSTLLGIAERTVGLSRAQAARLGKKES
jgi:RNA polymerase sigma-70 factor (ECF subfamily)